MGIFDKAKDLLNEHNDKVDQGIDKAAELIDQKTGGQHTEQIGQAAEQAKQAMDNTGGQPPV
ncbi:MAG TPA: antitoxin [Microlunatus sp.]|nr:antitoxin [Microlunatus sp.]